jgi:hypothetical protein
VNGNKVYDWRAILNATLPPVFPQNGQDFPLPSTPTSQTILLQETPPPSPQDKQDKQPPTSQNVVQNPTNKSYDDEQVANENYYEVQANEHQQLEQIIENAYTTRPSQGQAAQKGADVKEDGDAARVLHPFASQPDGYYLSVKGEIDELFNTYPRDDTLAGAFACSEWVRVRGEAGAPQYLVGVLYEDGKASYICYALAAQDKDQPPEEIKKVCAFVPSSLFDDTKGFFVIFQSAASGECIKPKQA